MSTVAHGKNKKKETLFIEVKKELKKVTWTSKEELKTCTKIVLCSTFMFGMGIYLTDLTIRAILDSISHICKLVLG